MGMVNQTGSPGVEHSRDADPGTEMLFVSGNGEQGLRSDLEQEVIDHVLVLVGDRPKRIGHGEHDMEVRDGQQILSLPLEPTLCG